MKKTILVVLMAVMIATPCFAQEVEPEGIFSIEGTRWEALPMGIHISPFPPSLEPIDWGFGFYGGEVYPSGGYSFYIDMLVCSIFSVEYGPGATSRPVVFYMGILQPIGIGMVIRWYMAYPNQFYLAISILIKASDNWAPPEVE